MRSGPERDVEERGTVAMRTNANGTIAVIGPVPRVVEMSRELFMDWVFEINEHRREIPEDA